MEIFIHNLDSELNITKQSITQFVRVIVEKLELDMNNCQIIFVDDETLRTMHQDYLKDPNYTDVMTFNLGDDKIEGEIYVSYDRVKENANIFEVTKENEIHRNIIHGLLHLKGYDDKSEPDRTEMKQKEEELLKETMITSI